MIPVKLTDEMKALARKYSDEIEENLKKRDGNNYTGLNVNHRWYCGYLGEQAFKRLLDVNKKKYEYTPKTDGFADSGDFVLFILKYKILVDVKTACFFHHTKIMMPKAQFDNYNYDYYIGVRLDAKGEIWGYAPKDKFKLRAEGFDEQKVPTMYMSLKSMKPIEELLEILNEQD